VLFWVASAGRRRDRIFSNTVICGCGGFAQGFRQAFPPADALVVVIHIVRERKNIGERETEKLLAVDDPQLFVRSDRIGQKATLVDLENNFSVAARSGESGHEAL
jgi:hypothetical protein